MTNTGLIALSSVRTTFQVKAFVPKHTINPPVIIFEENSLIRKKKKQLFTGARDISQVNNFALFIMSKQ